MWQLVLGLLGGWGIGLERNLSIRSNIHDWVCVMGRIPVIKPAIDSLVCDRFVSCLAH